MHDTRRSDQLVGRISSDIQARALFRDVHGDGPDVNRCKGPNDVHVIKVHLYPSELRELRDLPENDGRDRPSLTTEEPVLHRRQLGRDGIQEDVGVKIEHPTRCPSTGYLP